MEIDAESAQDYAKLLIDNGITDKNIEMLDRKILTELGITKIGHQMSILKLGKNSACVSTESTSVKSMSAKAPQLISEMTSQQFRKFKIDWQVFCEISNLPKGKYHVQLYSNAEESVQTELITTYPDYFSLDINTLMDCIEKVVTQRENPMIHRVSFANINQEETESVQNFVVRLRIAAKDCDCSCPHCKKDISEVYIKDKFICGIQNGMLQTDILAKSESLDSIEKTVKHAEAFESALRDQNMLVDNTEVAAAKISTYRAKKSEKLRQTHHLRKPPPHQPSSSQQQSPQSSSPQQHPCKGCAGFHIFPYRRQDVCPAWGKKCNNCGIITISVVRVKIMTLHIILILMQIMTLSMTILLLI